MGDVSGVINVGALDPEVVFLYFEVEQKMGDGWDINEFVYLDNVLITSDGIVGDIGPSPLAVSPGGKRTTTWAGLKASRAE